MPAWFWLALIVAVPIGLYFLYGLAYAKKLEQAFDAYLAQYDDPNRTQTLVVRTDGLFPELGLKPPESAMWRVRSGLYGYKGNLIPTYRYDPEQLQNADLDSHEAVDAEMRIMEAEGQALLDEAEEKRQRNQ